MRPPLKAFAPGFQILELLPWPTTIRKGLKVLKRKALQVAPFFPLQNLIHTKTWDISCRDSRCFRYGHQPDKHDQSPLWLSNHGSRNRSHLQQRDE